MKKHIQKLGELDQIIKKYVEVSNKKLHHPVPISKMYENEGEGERGVFADISAMKGGYPNKRAKTSKPTGRPVDDPDYQSIETATEDRIYTES